jgi:large subunit ribosomal protein L24
MNNDTVKTKLKVSDNVVVISGTEKGKRGKILKVNKDKGRVIIEGINKRNKFVKATQENPKGGVVNLEFPIALSNVMFFCEKCKKPTRIGIEFKDNAKI